MIFDGYQEYWGITFVDLPIERFDIYTPAVGRFTFDGSHYKEVTEGWMFRSMEGPKQVGEGRVISIEE